MYTFDTVVLYQNDIDSLAPCSWITDSILEFWLEYITKGTDIGYLGPSIVHLIRDSSQKIPIEFLDVQALNSKILLVPINDHQGEESGGCHWSLAAYLCETGKWIYYDSLKSKYNTLLAKMTCSKINEYLSGTFDFAQFEVNQQWNNYDCGLYVILLAECLSKKEIPKAINFDSDETRKRIINLIKQASAKTH